MISSLYEATFLVDFSKDIIVTWGDPTRMSTLKSENILTHLSLCDFTKLTTNMLNSLEFYTGGKAL